MEQQHYNAAIYCRLSKDDFLQGESSSIQNQKSMLSSYCTEQDWRVVDYYVDDGISGTTFERSGFKRMIDDVEQGKINLVITKDLSRLGRDYLKTGFYTECWFPENNVRFIALGDGIDTINQGNDIAPFKNILNELYAKDISKKIKAAFRVKCMRGDHQGAYAPFGYRKHPDIVGKLLIDEVSSQTVKLIFDLAKQGYGASRIKTVLYERKVLTPSGYLHTIDSKYYAKRFENAPEYEPYAWSTTAVRRVLDNEIYLGNTTHYREVSVSFKSKKRQIQPPDKWVTVENTHEPLIDRETWDFVHDKMQWRAKFVQKHEPNIFARIVRCADCGKAMWLTPPQWDFPTQKQSQRRYFQCVTNRQFGKYKCTMHNANYIAVYSIVLADLQAFAKEATEHEQELLDRLSSANDTPQRQALKQAEKELSSCNNRLNEIDSLLQRLFEENVAGRMNAANYERMFAKYQVEQGTLTIRQKDLQRQVDVIRESAGNAEKWIELIKKYIDLQELTAPIINELIERILIREPERIDGKRTQKIEIFYRFIGNVNGGESWQGRVYAS